MILSANQLFSSDQAITATAVSTNVLDLGAPGTVLGAPAAISRDIAKGNPVPILIQVTEDFDNLTSLSVAVQTDSTDAFASATTVLTSPAVLLASLVAGYKFAIIWLPLGITEQYVRLNYTVVGTAPTAGTITAGIAEIQTNT